MASNPFVYGEVVPPSAFIDREVELARLVNDLAASQKVFLISPRRYGKSSLIRQALVALARQRVLTIEVSVASYSSYVAFLEGYARHLLALERRAERARPWLAGLLDAFRADVRVEPRAGGGQQLSVAFPTVKHARDEARLAEEVFRLPGRIAEATGRRLAIALDEFQVITAYDGGGVEAALREAVQQQRNVGYVFAGSEPTLMEHMVTPRRPFYKAGPLMRLDRIPSDVFTSFVETRFRRSGFRVEKGLGAALVELAGNLPYDVQRLAHELWDDARVAGWRGVNVDTLHRTLRRLLEEQATLFEGVWQRLTLAQRAALRAVVFEQGRELLSGDVRVRYRLGGASSVQSALLALQRLDLVMREANGLYLVMDSLFREWVARKTY
ncbi:MAG: AAA family ATPase [Luteitalea sp.]|nr:AAA family ATPase [Luteitalea sp.]